MVCEGFAMKSPSKMLILATIIWGVLVIAGVKTLFDYSATPGAKGDPAKSWPAECIIDAPRDLPVLVMIAHPRCPCTRASVSELSRLMVQAQRNVKVYVLVFKPEGVPESWFKSDLWHSARDIPGVTIVPDQDGHEARRFNVSTSGHALLYDKSGTLRFSGGITSARGHEGDNQGVDLILAALNTPGSGSRSTPVFGCPVTVDSETSK